MPFNIERNGKQYSTIFFLQELNDSATLHPGTNNSSHVQESCSRSSSDSCSPPNKPSSRRSSPSAIQVPDEVLLSLSVRDLNKQLHGLPRDQVARVKQNRRTLKNRGYAQSCRSKQMSQKQDLEVVNDNLCREMEAMFNELNDVKRERDLLKQRLDTLLKQSQ